MKYRILHSLLLALSFSGATAQDPHFTQTGTLGSWYNPASIAPTEEPYRLQAAYRNQWASTGSPFITQGFFAERRLSEHALGVNIVSTAAGPGSLKQLSAGLQWSFTRQWGIHRFSGGVHGGFMQRSLETRGMTFDEQYDADQGFDPSVPTGESFAALRMFSPDFGAGFRWHIPADSRRMFSPFAGLGVHHLANKSERFLVNSYRTAQRMSVEAGTGIAWSESFMIRTSILHMRQGNSRAWQINVSPEWLLENGTGFGGSIVYRAQDAIALAAQVRWNRYGLGVSYDINTSGIQGGPGSVEVVLSYRPAGKPRAVKRMLTQQQTTPVQITKAAVAPPEELTALSLLTHKATQTAFDLVPLSKPVSPFTQLPQDTERVEVHQAMTRLPLTQMLIHVDATPEGRNDAIVTTMPIQLEEESAEQKNHFEEERITADGHESEREVFEVVPMVMRTIDSVNLSRVESQPAVELKTIPTAENPWRLPVQRADDELLNPIALLPSQVITISSIQSNLIEPVVEELKTSDVIVWSDEKAIEQMPVRMDIHTPMVREIHAEPVSISVMNASFAAPAESETTEPVHHAQHVDESILVPFAESSLRVHGLSKLDIIEPVLDRVLENPGLSIELSGVSSNGNLNEQRSVIIRQILVSKGLDPGRIRIVSHEASGDTGRDAVRMNILVNR
ncbi:MAG: PorP/SprF family type IX secretion system membrane protein [Sphingobacteriales bacterium]|nr:PorP/SprF family type IX secretion system membrane protein [Sphingobacteriales bacterium]